MHQSSIDRPFHRATGPGLLALLGILIPTCCTPSARFWPPQDWFADYDAAEARVRESGRELLIIYQDNRPGGDRALEHAVKSAAGTKLSVRHVRCVLSKAYEPDRRYVAQYGIERAPALILIHRDGTYHARSGGMSSAAVARFIANATQPGKVPVINPYVPRAPFYGWRENVDQTMEASRRSGKPALIVFYRSLTSDWARLEALLSRRDVYRRLAPLVHGRVSLKAFFKDVYISRFGALKLPAIVIAHDDSTHFVLEMPTSYDTVVRFADTALSGVATPASRSAGTPAQRVASPRH